jgi:hypothetical protein
MADGGASAAANSGPVAATAQQGGVHHRMMEDVQPSRHLVAFGGWLIMGPRLAPWGVGSREVPFLLAQGATVVTSVFTAYVARTTAARLLTLVLWLTVHVLVVRITCRDPGIVPRAWQITQSTGLRQHATTLLYGDVQRSGVVMGQAHTGGVCSTCRVVRPLGTSHCRVCDACIEGFDHHCVWLGTCIGARNHRDFMALLYAGVAVACFVTRQCCAVLLVRGGGSKAAINAGRAGAMWLPPPTGCDIEAGQWRACLASSAGWAHLLDALFRHDTSHIPSPPPPCTDPARNR